MRFFTTTAHAIVLTLVIMASSLLHAGLDYPGLNSNDDMLLWMRGNLQPHEYIEYHTETKWRSDSGLGGDDNWYTAELIDENYQILSGTQPPVQASVARKSIVESEDREFVQWRLHSLIGRYELDTSKPPVVTSSPYDIESKSYSGQLFECVENTHKNWTDQFIYLQSESNQIIAYWDATLGEEKLVSLNGDRYDHYRGYGPYSISQKYQGLLFAPRNIATTTNLATWNAIYGIGQSPYSFDTYLVGWAKHANDWFNLFQPGEIETDLVPSGNIYDFNVSYTPIWQNGGQVNYYIARLIPDPPYQVNIYTQPLVNDPVLPQHRPGQPMPFDAELEYFDEIVVVEQYINIHREDAGVYNTSEIKTDATRERFIYGMNDGVYYGLVRWDNSIVERVNASNMPVWKITQRAVATKKSDVANDGFAPENPVISDVPFDTFDQRIREDNWLYPHIESTDPNEVSNIYTVDDYGAIFNMFSTTEITGSCRIGNLNQDNDWHSEYFPFTTPQLDSTNLFDYSVVANSTEGFLPIGVGHLTGSSTPQGHDIAMINSEGTLLIIPTVDITGLDANNNLFHRAITSIELISDFGGHTGTALDIERNIGSQSSTYIPLGVGNVVNGGSNLDEILVMDQAGILYYISLDNPTAVPIEIVTTAAYNIIAFRN